MCEGECFGGMVRGSVLCDLRLTAASFSACTEPAQSLPTHTRLCVSEWHVNGDSDVCVR